MSWQRSEKPSNDEVVKSAPLKTLRLVDIIDSNIPALFDEFYHLPNVEVLHSSLEDPNALKDGDCLVIPIFSNEFRITPILRAVNGLLSPPAPSPSIIDQLKAMFNQKSFNGILSPNQILKIKVSIPTCSLSQLLAVTIWKNDESGSTPAAVTEVSITDAFQAVFNYIHEHNHKVEKGKPKYKEEKLIQTLISPFFSTAGITVKLDKAAKLMSSVYQTYLRANKIPIIRTRSPPGEELNFALKEGSIVNRGVKDPEELATLVRYAVNVEDKEELLAFSLPSISYLNHMISRPQTTTPILTWGREIVFRTMRESVSAPSAFCFPPLANISTLILEKLIQLCCEQKLIPWLQVKREDLKVFEIIGKGAYGKVRKAHIIRSNPKEPEEVAMKEFNVEDCLFDESLKNEILRETAIMCLCRHPRFLGCRGACFDPTEHWILTDLADCDLRTLLSEEGDRLAGELRLRIACQMAEGLAELHRLDLIHRDLKSANVLIVRRGSLELDIKIADFGLCRVTNNHMTQTTGTPLWRAPEVIGRNDYTKKADVYSFGIILWEILTGDVPYKELDGFSAYQFDDKIIAGYRPGIPKGFETHPFVQLMTACWQGNPKDRPDFALIASKLRGIAPSSMPSEGVKGMGTTKQGTPAKSSLFTWYKKDHSPTKETSSSSSSSTFTTSGKKTSRG